ncbi:hypothetical protein EYF80_035802 [Liparis tanakae]|uniref:Uncharacterized protein n=1 Tax=Liparis tanakae TaxID=230148 RepID=A0A4Z2GK82_9TELE|nr:hypothetical protein EYF80_035802 [Liparis tanakae]
MGRLQICLSSVTPGDPCSSESARPAHLIYRKAFSICSTSPERSAVRDGLSRPKSRHGVDREQEDRRQQEERGVSKMAKGKEKEKQKFDLHLNLPELKRSDLELLSSLSSSLMGNTVPELKSVRSFASPSSSSSINSLPAEISRRYCQPWASLTVRKLTGRMKEIYSEETPAGATHSRYALIQSQAACGPAAERRLAVLHVDDKMESAVVILFLLSNTSQLIPSG